MALADGGTGLSGLEGALEAVKPSPLPAHFLDAIGGLDCAWGSGLQKHPATG